MEYVSIGKNTKLSRIIQGFWRLQNWNMTTKELTVFLEGCMERGVTTFDTAEIYGMDSECEKQIGQALCENPSFREKIQLITKTGISRIKRGDQVFGYYDTTYERIKNSCKDSLKRLKTDYIDVYLIHREDPCMDPYETARALLELKKEGLVKEIGVSNFDPFKFDALQYAANGELVTNQIEWNPVCFEHFNSGMIDLLGKQKISPMIWSPLAGGKLFTEKEGIYARAYKKIQEIAKRYEVEEETIVYAWLLYHPMKAIPINGSRKLYRLDYAINALAIQLKHYEWFEIYTASGQQKIR